MGNEIKIYIDEEFRPRKHSFHLKTEKIHFSFAANSENERQEWMDKMRTYSSKPTSKTVSLIPRPSLGFFFFFPFGEESTMYSAALANDSKKLESLIDSQSVMRPITSKGETSLHVTVANNFRETSLMLLGRGADLNLQGKVDSQIKYPKIYDKILISILQILMGIQHSTMP